MSEQQPSLPEWQRLHPSAAAIWTVERMRTAVFGLIAAGASRRLWIIGAVSVGILVAGVGLAVLRQRRFLFRIEGSALVVRDGVIQVRHTVIPLERIQSVDIVEKLRHKIFGVVELRAEAIGGQQTEASFVALPRDAAEDLRRRLLRLREAEQSMVDESPVLAKLGPRDLALAGLTGGRVAIFAVILGYLDDLLPGDMFELLFRRAFQRAESGGSWVAYLLVPVAVIFGVSVALSLVATALRYWDFTVTHEEERLLITRGLLDKRRSAIPLKKLQAVRVVENPIRRLFRLASLTVVVAGYSGPREEVQETSMLLPIARRDKAIAIASRLTGIPEPIGEFQGTPARAMVPRLVVSALISLVVMAVGRLGMWPPDYRFITTAGVVLMVFLIGMSFAGWRARAYSFTDRFVVLRSGVVIRRTTLIPLTNVQNLKINAGPLNQALGLASLTFGVPKSPSKAWGLDREEAFNSFEAFSEDLSS